MNDLFINFQTQLDRATKYLEVRPDILEILKWPQRVIELSLAVKMDNGETKLFRGFRSQHNNFRGPYKGGIRFHPQVTREEVIALSAWMSLKCAVAGIPFGGGKGGVIVNPKELSLGELERLSRAYAAALTPFIGPYVDVPAPDVNTNPEIMAWMVDEYRKKLKTKSLKLKANEILATFTGKPAKIGGSLGRTEATGRGGVYILQELLAKLKSSKHEARNSKQVRNSNVSTSKRFGFRISDFGFPQSIRIAVQGMGNVGYYFAKLAREQGFRIVALSDSKGGIIVNEKLKTKNLRIDEVMKWKKKTGSVVGFPGTTQITNDELLTTDCDILVPSALESVISEKNAGEIRAKVIIEMANGPVTPEADEILAKRGVFLVPDILANSGGVTVSYFEWLQNLKKQKWAEEKVNLELKKNLTQVFDDAWQISKKHGVDLRIAAYILAVDRIIKGE